MSAIDWQAYLDGSLPPDERRLADQELEKSSRARGQLEGLREFRSQIRAAGLCEAIPHARLENALKASIPTNDAKNIGSGRANSLRRRFNLWRIGALVAGASAIAVFYLATISRTPVETTLGTHDPVQAARWINDQTGLNIKPIRLSGAKLVMAEVGDGWGCYCWSVDGEMIHVRMSRDDRDVSGLARSTVGEREYFVGPGIGWKAGGMTYYVHGGSEATRWKVVRELS